MDDRACVAVLLVFLKELQNVNHLADVYAVATVQEEVGVRGATTSTYGIMPDIGIALDVGHGDMPGVQDYRTIKVGGGPGIALGPHVHPKLYERFVQTAKDWNISYTLEPQPAQAEPMHMQFKLLKMEFLLLCSRAAQIYAHGG